MRRAVMPLRWIAVTSVIAAMAALAHAAPAEQTPSTRARSGKPPGRLRVYGYPYASRCPAAGIAERIDRWRMDMCNCTSYVAWALQVNGQRISWFIPGAMNAWNWPHVAELAGLRAGDRPRAGAVAVWAKLAPPFGHVAYVTSVDPDGRFDVSEYNLVAPYLFDRRDDVPVNGAVFIYVPPAPTVAIGAGD